MSPRVRPGWLRYGVAIAVTAAALALKLLLVPLIKQDAPFLLFFAAVLVAAGFGGLGPGLLVTFLAAALNDYYFIEPFGTFALTSDQMFRLILFVVEGTIISIISARLRTARKRAEVNAAEARQLERRILEISDAEQRRIGHDLHDGLGQHLTGIALLVRRLERRLVESGSVDADDARKLAELAKTAVEWTHDLSRSLSPPALESAGLAEALRELAANAETIFNVRCTFEQAGDVRPVDLAAAVHLYRIAQEAISNAVHHGGARDVRIELTDLPTQGIAVRVSDDGIGIQPEIAEQAGMGLRIMRYRARMIGATIDVHHRDMVARRGTVVTCSYPHSAGDAPSLRPDASSGQTGSVL